MRDYVANTNASETDSAYLRRVGLKPNVLELCGDCSGRRVLDIGAADGWLRRELPAGTLVECDIAPPGTRSGSFVVCDAAALPFAPGSFDVVVSSLVLMWMPDLDTAYRTAFRITRPGGRLVVALVHPYFYRTGRVTKRHYALDRDLSTAWELDGHTIAGRTGPFRYHYHRYDAYLGNALAAGWKLDMVRDWFIDLADYRAHVRENLQVITRSGSIPLYSFLKFTKMGS